MLHLVRNTKCTRIRSSRTLHSIDKIQRLMDELDAQQLDMEMQYQALQEALEELEVSRNRYAELYDFAPVGYITLDYKGCIREINLTGAAMIGKERTRLIGTPMYVCVVKSDIKMFMDHLRRCKRTGEKVITDLGLAVKNGATIQVQLLSVPLQSADGRTLHFKTIISDITERKLIEKELSRLERLNIVGEMSASIAHEIRNPMTTVRGFLQISKGKSEYAHQEKYFDIMINELDRANGIITEFLALAKNKDVHMSYQNLNTIIESLYPLLQADALAAEKNYNMELGTIPKLMVDDKEIRQLIVNLFCNGLQAMAPGGNLAIRTFVDGETVVLAVQDQGTGIPSDVLERLGTPFLSTKENGTGLGLAVCYSIAARHNAIIKVDTGPDGTTFFVLFRLM